MNRNAISNQNQSLSQVFAHEKKSNKSLLEKILKIEKEIVAKLEQIHSLRIIEKLARPVQSEKKLILLTTFSQLVECVHEKMAQLESDFDLGKFYFESQVQQTHKSKIKLQQNMQVKLSCLNVRKKYSEVLIQSSVVHFKKICDTFHLDYELSLRDPDKWLSGCMNKLEKRLHNEKQQSCC